MYLSFIYVFMYLKITLTAQSKVVLRIIYILWHVSQINSIVFPRDRKRSALLCFRKSGLAYGSPGGLEFSALYLLFLSFSELTFWYTVAHLPSPRDWPFSHKSDLISSEAHIRERPDVSSTVSQEFKTVCLILSLTISQCFTKGALTVTFSWSGTHWV